MNKQEARILVVDDEVNLLEAVKTHLELEGFQVDVADSASQALDMFGSGQYAIVMTDINMPGMDGLELLKRLKEIRGETVVIMITAYTSLTKVLQSQKMGAADYLLKPFMDLGVVTAAVERAFAILGRWARISEDTRKMNFSSIT